MKKTYIAPALHTMELGTELLTTIACSAGRTTGGFKSAENENVSNESIWDNNTWGAADED